MKNSFPKIKKKVSSFLLGEEGKITKESLIKSGAFLGGVALSGALMAKSASAVYNHSHGPDNGNILISHPIDKTTTTISHNHHMSHSSHSNAGGSGGGWW